jgi:hypothetical protein
LTVSSVYLRSGSFSFDDGCKTAKGSVIVAPGLGNRENSGRTSNGETLRAAARGREWVGGHGRGHSSKEGNSRELHDSNFMLLNTTFKMHFLWGFEWISLPIQGVDPRNLWGCGIESSYVTLNLRLLSLFA